ncbi:MAG TPA: hypothetical protein VFJ82_00935 [Longimicrobium sp.]|nr:hypothetical protein [Longimicrobium sp.]
MIPNRNDAVPSAGRRSWVSPKVTDLPRLTQLTLSTTNGPSIPGESGSGGGGVIP